MNVHRAHTEILILAVAAVLVLFVSVAAKAPQSLNSRPSLSTPVQAPVEVQPVAAPAALRAVSAQGEGEWVRAETLQAPAKQTRWVF